MNQVRKIQRIIDPTFVMEGAGVRLRRSISPHASNKFDPFLLFDHFAFNDPIEGPLLGFPMHPHRGIETVTYMLEGATTHRDSLGNSDMIGPGDVQWMTAGRGILHEEMPRRGPNGAIDGFQLWVNLPARLKMTAPRYQGVSETTIPSVKKDGATVRIVTGEVFGVKGPVTEIAADPLYVDVTLEPGAQFVQEIPAGHTAVAYVFQGEGEFGATETGSGEPETIAAVRMVVFGDGDQIHVSTEHGSGVRFMLIAGAPFQEPIVPYGPFVMNTVEEIQQALVDLRNGTFVV